MSEVSEPLDEGSDVALRKFIVKHYGCYGAHEIDGRIFVENMDHIFQWIRGGKVPSTRKRPTKTLQVAEQK